jgi:pimeloyl-ACP methyl ester carboxylesterase
MGGNLAALYAYAYPEEVLSLGLFNNSGILAPNENEFQRAVAKGKNPLIVNSIEDFDRLLAYVSHKEPYVPWPIKGVLAKRALEHAAFNQSIFADLRKDDSSNLLPILPLIDCPALILWGEYDRVLDVSIIDVMQPLMPRAEVIVMKNTGHVPMLERPKESATHYRRFTERVSAQQAP